MDGREARPWAVGGRLEPCWRGKPPLSDPNVGVVARWINSGGGGDIGRPGAASCDEVDDVGILLSGMNGGGGILFGGGGARGGGGSTIIGGRRLSTGAGAAIGTRERGVLSSAPDNADSIDCLLSWVNERGAGIIVATESLTPEGIAEGDGGTE